MTDQNQACMKTIAGSLFSPNTARFSLSPSGQSVLAGYVDAQDRLGAYLRREVWCEFSASGNEDVLGRNRRDDRSSTQGSYTPV